MMTVYVRLAGRQGRTIDLKTLSRTDDHVPKARQKIVSSLDLSILPSVKRRHFGVPVTSLAEFATHRFARVLATNDILGRWCRRKNYGNGVN